MERLVAGLTALLLLAGVSEGAIVTVPGDLNAGDTYRLVFTTSTVTDAQLPDIDYYNDFVTAAANGSPDLVALGTNWRAIVSTSTVGAAWNTGTSPKGPAPTDVPIYRLDGTRVYRRCKPPTRGKATTWPSETGCPDPSPRCSRVTEVLTG